MVESDVSRKCCIHEGFHQSAEIIMEKLEPRRQHSCRIKACEYCGKLTVKRLELKPTVRLVPMSRYSLPLVIPEGENLQVFGVVTTVSHFLRKP